MVPKTPSIPSWKFAVGNIQHNFLSLSDVTPEISHWRADVRIGGRQGQRHRNLRKTFQLSLFVVSVDCNKGPVAELVGIEVGVVSGVMNLESSGVEASDWRPRHEQVYHDA